MAFSIIKHVYKFDENCNQVSDGIEIIQSHDRYNRSVDYYKKVVSETIDSLSKENKVITNNYRLGNDYVAQITGDYESVDVIFTDDWNLIKYL